MNDIKIKPITAWNILFYASLAAILVLVWYSFLRPSPTASATAWKKTVDEITAKKAEAQSASSANLAMIQNRTWGQSLDNLGSVVLDQLTRLADKHNLQLANFRTERPSEFAHLTEAPFVLVVEGSFPNVLAFLQSVETPSTKLSVNMLQMTASDGAPGNVTATLGLAGYRKEEV